MEDISGKLNRCNNQELNNWPQRPSEFHRYFEEARPRVINQQLKELEYHGVIGKPIYPELPPRSEYFLTEIGKSLLPIIDRLEEWGDKFRPKMIEILEREDS